MNAIAQPAVGSRYYVFASHSLGKIANSARDQFWMLDDVCRVAHDARHDHLSGRQVDVFPDSPLVLVAHVARLETVHLRAHLEHEIDDFLERHIMCMCAVPASPAKMVAD